VRETARSYVRAHLSETVAQLVRLCSLPSIAARGEGQTETAELVSGLLQAAGFATRLLTVEGAPPAVYGELCGSRPVTLLLYNHYDVQPADPMDQWTSPPFAPTVRDGNLYARGTSDNKGEIVARLAALRAIIDTSGRLPVSVRWIIEGEEEVGSPHFEALAREHAGLLSADCCLWEGAGFDSEDRPEVMLGTKGLLYVQLDVHGVSHDAHSGRAPILPSAAWRLVSALASLRDPDGRVRVPGFCDAVREPTPAQRDALARQTNMERQLLDVYGLDEFVDGLTGVPLRRRQAFSPTSNIAGLLSGYVGEGVKTVLPAHAMAKLDFRLVPDQDPADILAKLRDHLDHEGFRDVEVSHLGSAEPVATPMEEPFVRQVLTASADFNGREPSVYPIVGGTLPLLGALRRHVGVPGLSAATNPSYWASGAHGPDEHIRLADLERAVNFNCALLESLGSAGQAQSPRTSGE
jgi:acetylornithine deacetylase/succinyl-diaminopimelate desuccinylase-like protein